MKHNVINYQLGRALSLAALIPCGQCRRGSIRPTTRMARATSPSRSRSCWRAMGAARMSPPDDGLGGRFTVFPLGTFKFGDLRLRLGIPEAEVTDEVPIGRYIKNFGH